MFSAHTTTVVNGGRQIWTDLDHVFTKSLVKPPKNWKSIDVSFSTSSENFWNRMTFLNKHSDSL